MGGTKALQPVSGTGAKTNARQKCWYLVFKKLSTLQEVSLLSVSMSRLCGRQCAVASLTKHEDRIFIVVWKKDEVSYDAAKAWCRDMLSKVRGQPLDWFLCAKPEDVVVTKASELGTIQEEGVPPESSSAAPPAAPSLPDSKAKEDASVGAAASSACATLVAVAKDVDDALAGLPKRLRREDDTAASSGGPPESEGPPVDAAKGVPTPSHLQWLFQKAVKICSSCTDLLDDHCSALSGFNIKYKKAHHDTLHSTTYLHDSPGCTARAQTLVIKVLKQKTMEVFLAEVGFLSKLVHPNIVELYDVGSLGGRCVLITKFGGLSLSHHIKKGVTPFVDIFGSLIMQLLTAVTFIHSHDVMHRDLKPGNIVVDFDAGEPGGGVVRLIDFGMACVDLKDHRTKYGPDRLGLPYCTLPYRAPELLLGCVDYTRAVDIWSLGCIMFELITGNRLIQETRCHLACVKMLFAQLGQGVPDVVGCLGTYPGFRPTMVVAKGPIGFHSRMQAQKPLGATCVNFVFSMLHMRFHCRPTAAELLNIWKQFGIRGTAVERG